MIQVYDSLLPSQSAEETLVISVENLSPRLGVYSDSISVSEYQNLGIIYTVNATDADGDELTYTFADVEGVVNNFLWLNPSTGEIVLQRSLTTISTNTFSVRSV